MNYTTVDLLEPLDAMCSHYVTDKLLHHMYHAACTASSGNSQWTDHRHKLNLPAMQNYCFVSAVAGADRFTGAMFSANIHITCISIQSSFCQRVLSAWTTSDRDHMIRRMCHQQQLKTFFNRCLTNWTWTGPTVLWHQSCMIDMYYKTVSK